MLLASSAGLFALALLWVYVAHRRPAFLLPLYIVAAIPPAPGALDLSLFPDLGLGGLERPFPTDGDVLLLATALYPPVARSLFRPHLPGLIVALSSASLVGALIFTDYPTESLILYGTSFLRVGLMLAVLRWAHERDPSPASWMWPIFGSLCLFYGSAVVFVAGPHLGLQWLVDVAALREPLYGRLDFPRLGNNKIGLAIVMLTTALVMTERGMEDRSTRVRLLVPVALVAGIVTCLIADLRFSTTSLGVLLMAYLFSSRRRAPYGAAVLALGVAGILLSPLTTAAPRALTVLMGDFDLLNDSSLNSRFEMWQGALRVWAGSPLWGELGGWEYRRPVQELVLIGPLETHSEFMWWMASLGALGLLALLTLLAAPARAAFRGSLLTAVAMVVTLGALALNAASLYPITGACLAAVSMSSAMVPRPPRGSRRKRPSHSRLLRHPRKFHQS